MIIHSIPENDMREICSKIICSAHGTGKFKNKEKQISINITDDKFKKYRVSEEEVIEIVR